MGATGAVDDHARRGALDAREQHGQALSGSRNLFALAEQGDLPPFFGRVHPRFGTPVIAILFTAVVALVLAVSGTFVTMAAASAISRLIVYVATCAAALRLRGMDATAGGGAGALPRAVRSRDPGGGDDRSRSSSSSRRRLRSSSAARSRWLSARRCF